MSLMLLHRIFIGAAIVLCLVYAVFELSQAQAHSAPRALLGIGVPALAAGVLGAYFHWLVRRR